MNLFLVQHGQAKTKEEDRARSLNDAGVNAVEKVAKWLSASETEVDEIRHSGKKRAEQCIPQGIAADISRLVAGSVRIGDRPVGLGDIAVLVRTNRQAVAMQRALRQLEIPSVLHGAASR